MKVVVKGEVGGEMWLMAKKVARIEMDAPLVWGRKDDWVFVCHCQAKPREILEGCLPGAYASPAQVEGSQPHAMNVANPTQGTVP